MGQKNRSLVHRHQAPLNQYRVAQMHPDNLAADVIAGALIHAAANAAAQALSGRRTGPEQQQAMRQVSDGAIG